MTRSRGYGLLVSPEGQQESDWLKCNHCQRGVQIKPFQPVDEVGGHCRVCDSFLCPDCETKRAQGIPCLPWEKLFDKIEAQERARQSYGV